MSEDGGFRAVIADRSPSKSATIGHAVRTGCCLHCRGEVLLIPSGPRWTLQCVQSSFPSVCLVSAYVTDEEAAALEDLKTKQQDARRAAQKR